ncbi:MAG: type II secretion system protein GspG [Candidatus Babeliales bacterium]
MDNTHRHAVAGHVTRGFSIAELMIYITIVGILMVATITGFRGFLLRAKRSSTEQSLKSAQMAIETYQADYGKYPSRLEDLVEKPKADLGKKWHQIIDVVPKDGWKQDLIYRATPGSKHPYELYSTAGAPGGEENPEEQISVWD